MKRLQIARDLLEEREAAWRIHVAEVRRDERTPLPHFMYAHTEQSIAAPTHRQLELTGGLVRSGYLLRAQRLGRIHPPGPTRRNPARQGRHRQPKVPISMRNSVQVSNAAAAGHHSNPVAYLAFPPTTCPLAMISA